MTHEELMAACVDPKTRARIQVRSFTDSPWENVQYVPLSDRCFYPDRWRLAPEPLPPTMVPLGPGDVPPGSVVKRKGEPDWDWWYVKPRDYGVTFIGERFILPGGQTAGATWAQLREEYLISRDLGKTWAACEKEAT